MAGRALHYVYKIANRTKTIDFYRNVLNMKCLRHEEFEEGCKASCNGPYDGKWSKSMFGYGDEDNNFVVELTYNYGIKEYKNGNDYNYFEIDSFNVFNNIKSSNYKFEIKDNVIELFDPNGYKFRILDNCKDLIPKVTKVSLSSSNLIETERYWNQILHLKILSKKENSIEFAFDKQQTRLEFIIDSTGVNHETAFGRIAFSCLTSQLEIIQAKIDDFNGKYKILTRLVCLDTPGKTSVYVVILADPDGHEICFVGDEGFRQLSKVDPNSDKLLDDAIFNDKSDEWFEKKEKKLDV